MDVTTRKLTRSQLCEFLPNDRAIRAFENLQTDAENSGDVLSTGQFLVISANDQLGNDRVFLAEGGLQAVDGGAGEDYAVSLTDTGVAAGTYGSASQTIRIVVDAKGRLSSVTAFALNTNNIAEGGSNLYFTNARARAAISGSGQISYNSTTGVIGSTGFSGTGAYTNFVIQNGIVVSAS